MQIQVQVAKDHKMKNSTPFVLKEYALWVWHGFNVKLVK